MKSLGRIALVIISLIVFSVASGAALRGGVGLSSLGLMLDNYLLKTGGIMTGPLTVESIATITTAEIVTAHIDTAYIDTGSITNAAFTIATMETAHIESAEIWDSLVSNETVTGISTIEFADINTVSAESVTAEVFESTIATGTPPFVVASTTKVDNLNAAFFDGHEWSETRTITLGAAEKFTIDAFTTDHTDTSGVIDLDVDAGASGVIGINSTMVSKGNYSVAGIQSNVESGGMSAGKTTVGSAVYISDHVDDSTNSFNIGQAIINTNSTTGEGTFYGQTIVLNTAQGGSDLLNTGAKAGYNVAMTDAGGTGHCRGLQLIVENKTNPANLFGGLDIVMKPNVAGITNIYGVRVLNSGTEEVGHSGFALSDKWTTGLDFSNATFVSEAILLPDDGNITTEAGNLILAGGGGTTEVVGTLEVTEDVYVGGDSKVDGAATFNSMVTGTIVMTGGNPIYSASATGTFLLGNNYQTNNTMSLNTGSTSNSLLIVEYEDYSFDFEHTQQPDPTLFGHSTNQSTLEWWSITHDQSDGIITTGAGNLKLSGASGTTEVVGNLIVTGFVSAETFESIIATGTAPLVVASTTKVTNLNADTVDGMTSTDLVAVAGDDMTGTLTNSADVHVAGKIGIGTTEPASELDVDGDVNVIAGNYYKYGGVNFAFADTAKYNYFSGGAGNLTATGDENTGMGYQALLATTSGYENTAIGHFALRSNTTGEGNVAIGKDALGTNTYGEGNTAIGIGALFSNTYGITNVGIGKNALRTNTTGRSNTAMGNDAMQMNTTGHNNTGIGYDALWSNTTGLYNTAVGYAALIFNTTGESNTALGYAAGWGDGTTNERTVVDTYSTFIGYQASRNANVLSTTPLTNATAIGYQAKVGASNALVLGGTGAYAVKVGIGTTEPQAELDVVGDLDVDGAATVGGVIYANSNIAMSTVNSIIYYAGTTGALQLHNSSQTVPAPVILAGSSPNYILFCEYADEGFDFEHTQQPDPTLFGHSTNQSTIEWWGITHDQTDGVITTGKGDLKLAPASGTTEVHDLRVTGTIESDSPVHIAGGAKVIGTIESTTGGIKFPDGSLQTTSAVDKNYGEMYWNNNGNPTVIETANTPIMVRQTTTGLLEGWTYDAGSTGEITAYSDYSGTVGGTVLITDEAHGLVTGDDISIRGAANYLGIYTATRVSNDDFYITHSWDGDDGASDWDEGSYLEAGAGSAGKYAMGYSISGTEAGGGGSDWISTVYVNSTGCGKCVGKRKMVTNDYGNLVGHSIKTIADGDRLYLTVQSTGTNNLTVQYGNLDLHRL